MPAQDALLQIPAFDVATIKPYGPEDLMVGIRTTADGISVTGMPLAMLMHQVLGLPNDRILGVPDWAKSNRYDIEAKVAPEDAPKLKQLTPQQRWEMFLPVFEERCGLKFHHEIRQLEVYDLVVAKGGPKLQLSRTAGNTTGTAPGRITPSAGVSIGDRGLTISAHGASTPAIARMISGQIGATVVDRTGLTGAYDFRLQFAADEGVHPMMMPRGGPPSSGAAGPGDAGPSIFTAVQEQLGLKLVAEKQSVDVVVIDHIEQPSEN